jgi:hypothetical protein
MTAAIDLAALERVHFMPVPRSDGLVRLGHGTVAYTRDAHRIPILIGLTLMALLASGWAPSTRRRWSTPATASCV